MVDEKIEENVEVLLDNVVKEIQDLRGIDLVYFLNGNNQIIKEIKFTNASNYLDQVLGVIGSEPLLNDLSSFRDLGSLHTFSLLNESGLIVISKMISPVNLYLIVIAGENEPVDLVNLLKICKEFRLSTHT